MDYDNPIKEKINAFHQRHGSECYTDGAAYYYADGAIRDVDPKGALIEPPGTGRQWHGHKGAEGQAARDEYFNAGNIVTFYRLKLKSAVRDFDELNTRLAYTLPGDPDAEIAKLTALQKVVEERKELLNKAEQGLANTQLGQLRAARLRDEETMRQHMLDFQSQRRLVRI